MQIKEQFINLPVSALKKLADKKLSTFEINLYLYLCRKATFKYQLFGVYQRETFQTLLNAVNKLCGLTKEEKDITQYKRAITKLEKLQLVKLQHSKGELIISLDPKATITDTVRAIENDLKAFSIYPDRIKELQTTIGVNVAHAYQNKEKQEDERADLTDEEITRFGWDK